MQATAKIFTTGASQAVRLPKAFRVNVAEVWISKNEVTGEITLKPKDEDQRQRNLTELFRLIKENPGTDEFVPERLRGEVRNPFAETTKVAEGPAKARATKKRGA
jgi:antitoxin VapB